MNKFRPQEINRVHIIRLRLKGYGNEWINYNWQTRVQWFPVGYELNKRTIARQFSRLHYLACHAPDPVTKKWKSVYNQFMRKHCAAGGKHSMRFANTHTAHSWL
jgi:hypothetical protein